MTNPRTDGAVQQILSRNTGAATNSTVAINAHTLDYSVQAHTALDRIEKLTNQIGQAVPMCRRAWVDYGTALSGQRKVMRNNKAFGMWVKAAGLNRKPCDDPKVRSEAMWLGEHWAVFQPLEDRCPYHHPTRIHQWAREQNLPWTGETALATAPAAKRAASNLLKPLNPKARVLKVDTRRLFNTFVTALTGLDKENWQAVNISILDPADAAYYASTIDEAIPKLALMVQKLKERAGQGALRDLMEGQSS
jgi:hypothetical protein